MLYACDILPEYVSVHQSGAHRGQKRKSDLLEMEFQVVVNAHVGARSRTWVIWKNT